MGGREHQVERQGEQRGRDEDGAEHGVEHRLAAPEGVLREDVPGHGGEQCRHHGSAHRVEHAVEQPAAEDAVLDTEQGRDVVHQFDPPGEPEAVAGEQVAAALGGGDDQPPDRQQGVERGDQQDGDHSGPAGPVRGPHWAPPRLLTNRMNPKDSTKITRARITERVAAAW